MSGLSYICAYNSDSDFSEDDECKEIEKRVNLPSPNLSRVAVIGAEEHTDDPQQHGGRIRSFPHVRGNWATFVCIRYPKQEAVTEFVSKVQSELLSIKESLQIQEHFHVSVSKTVVLKYHLITPFISSLREAISDTESFELGFDSIKIYCNEDQTRTFVALQVDHFSKKFLTDITEKIDVVLTDFRLPTFYEDPSFHMSILWTKGNKKSELEIFFKKRTFLERDIENIVKTLSVSRVDCKSGNKNYNFILK